MNAAATQTRTAGARQIFNPQTPSQSSRSLYTFPPYCRTRVDGVNTFRCIRSSPPRLFASFRVVKFRVFAGHATFVAGSIPGSSTNHAECIFWLMCKHVNISSTMRSRIGAYGVAACRSPDLDDV